MIEKLSNEGIENLLSKNIIGRIGCCDGRKVYVVPVNYVYDGQFIIAHSPEGKKIEMMRKNPDVCFEVDEMSDMIHWQSVIVWGTYQELLSERDRYHAMQLFTQKMMHMKTRSNTPIVSQSAADAHTRFATPKVKPVIYRIVPIEKTGRFEHGNMPG